MTLSGKQKEEIKNIVFVGMAYNPYEPEEYRWPLPLDYLKLGEDLLIGQEFWNFLGGDGAYGELLEIFENIGKELKERIESKIKSLANLEK